MLWHTPAVMLLRVTLRAATAVAALTAAAPAQVAPQPVRLAPVRGLDALVPVPDDNPLVAPAVALGRRLFFDAILSGDGTRSCASCHLPARAFADTVPISTGVAGARGRRNAPSLVNAAWVAPLFWDGRAATLEAQVLLPLEDPLELNADIDQVVARLSDDAGYRAAFRSTFNAPPSPSLLARALASFVRTIRSGDAPVDRFRAGDAGALSDAARTGFALFNGRANCATCHGGAIFSDGRFHNTGVAWNGVTFTDSGRFAITGNTRDIGAFRTPTLRDLVHTAPYMHDGSMATLEDVVRFYDAGGRVNPHLDAEIRPLRLTPAEQAALVEFLRSLTGTVTEGHGGAGQGGSDAPSPRPRS